MSNKLIVLVGNIGSGKSTWIKKYKETHEDVWVVSRDNIRYALGDGEYIYDKDFESYIQYFCSDIFNTLVDKQVGSIIIDETNMTRKVRKRYLRLNNLYIPEYRYHTQAIVFPDLGENEHVRRRLGDNHGDTEEGTWIGVYRGLRGAYEAPTGGEGFDEVSFI